MVLAQEEARTLGHDHIGTEHLLLGLIHDDDGVAVEVLRALGVSIDGIRADVHDAVGRGEGSSLDHIAFTPRAKKVLELSLREALQLGHDYIGTEHILLGLFREGDGVAAQVLRRDVTDIGTARQAVLEVLGRHAGGAGPDPSSTGAELGSAAAPGPEPIVPEAEEEEPWRSPLCPNCGAELATSAAYRSITVPDEEDRNGRPVVFVFCKACSHAVGVLPPA